MLFAIGAASSAIDLLKSLTASKTSSPQAANFSATTSAASGASSSAIPATATASVSGSSSQSGCVAPETMSALLDAQSQSTATSSSTTATKSQSKALKDLFNLIDGNGDGSITKSEFVQALGAGGTNTANADSVFSKLDKDGDGSVSLDELSAALKGGKGKHAHRARPPGVGDQTDPLLKALDEANTASAESRKANASYQSNSQVVQQQAQVSAAASGSALSFSA